MIELARLARDGALREFFTSPPASLTPPNGVTGVQLAYNESFIAALAKHLYIASALPTGSVEHSALVAAALDSLDLANPQVLEDPQTSTRTGRWPYVTDRLLTEWRELSLRRYGRVVSPIEIHITVDGGYPRLASLSGEGVPRAHEHFPIILRRASQPRLHLAESGGRVCRKHPTAPGPSTNWGTLGGFLVDQGSHFYATTAEHVLSGISNAKCTPNFSRAAALRLHRAFQRMSPSGHGLLPVGLRSETGQVAYSSPADRKPAMQCSANSAPSSSGLDFGILELPRRPPGLATFITQIQLGEVSQVLRGRFVGARSGAVDVRVTSYSVWQSYDLDDNGGTTACMTDCIQIGLLKRPYVWTDVSGPGDSGAWILAGATDGPRWLGQLVGGDGERSALVPAHRIVQNLPSPFSHMLIAV